MNTSILSSLSLSELRNIIHAASDIMALRTSVPARQNMAPQSRRPKIVPQLQKVTEWVKFVLNHARHHGWEPFMVIIKNRVKGNVEIMMPKGINHNGTYIFEGSIDNSNPNGKQITYRDAMYLSKHYWAAREQKGIRPDLYREFEEGYQESYHNSNRNNNSNNNSNSNNSKTNSNNNRKDGGRHKGKRRTRKHKSIK